MKPRFIVCFLLVLALCSAFGVHAQDVTAAPQAGTRADNECYAGGTMAGRCDNGFHADGSTTPDEVAWAWRCGWYMARFNDKRIGRNDVPNDCASIMPGIGDPAPVCFVVQNQPGLLNKICVSGSDAIQIYDVQVGGTHIHKEQRILWIVLDTLVGDSGKCANYMSDLSGLNGLPVLNWLQGIWLNAGYKGTDDVCSL